MHRHLYALYCLLQREREREAREAHAEEDERPTSPASTTSSGSGARDKAPLPAIFTDNGWHVLGRSILSTSNCGNPALRLFGFGPVAADGFGIGYIVKDEGVSVCASSKHLQTRRFLDTLQGYLLEVQRMLVQLHLAANQRAEPWVDHAGVLRDARTGRRIHTFAEDESDTSEEDFAMSEFLFNPSPPPIICDEDTGMLTVYVFVRIAGYSFFDSGDVRLLGRSEESPTRHQRQRSQVGKVIPMAEY